MTDSSTVSSSVTCFLSFIFIFLSNYNYCSNNFLSRFLFSISLFFIVHSRYFLNIICYTIFSVVLLTYFVSFPILISGFFCISIFIILFSNLFIFLRFFLNLLYVLFTVFIISFINISIFLDSMLFDFYNFLPFLRGFNI